MFKDVDCVSTKSREGKKTRLTGWPYICLLPCQATLLFHYDLAPRAKGNVCNCLWINYLLRSVEMQGGSFTSEASANTRCCTSFVWLKGLHHSTKITLGQRKPHVIQHSCYLPPPLMRKNASEAILGIIICPMVISCFLCGRCLATHPFSGLPCRNTAKYAILRYRAGWLSCLALCPARQPSLIWRDFLISVLLKGAYVGTSGNSSAFAIDSSAHCLDCIQGYILLKRGARLRPCPPHRTPVSSRLTMRESFSNYGNATYLRLYHHLQAHNAHCSRVFDA